MGREIIRHILLDPLAGADPTPIGGSLRAGPENQARKMLAIFEL
jgi:hypothetical protein